MKSLDTCKPTATLSERGPAHTGRRRIGEVAASRPDETEAEGRNGRSRTEAPMTVNSPRIIPQFDDLLDERQAAARLSVSSMTLRNWRRRNIGPRFVRFGRPGGRGRILYQRADVERFIVEHLVVPQTAKKTRRRR